MLIAVFQLPASDVVRTSALPSGNRPTLAKKPAIKVGEDADGIVVDPATNRVFIIDGDPGTLSVVDPEIDAVIATIDGGGALEFGVADGLGHLYVDGKAATRSCASTL